MSLNSTYLTACAVLALLLAGCRSKAEPGQSPFPDTDLIVLSDLEHPPFAFLGAEDEPRGLEVELVEELAARMNRDVVWRRHPFKELLPRIQAGEAHLVAATIGINPERAQRVAFSRPYFTTDLVVVVRRGAGEPIGLHELAGKQVAAEPGTNAAYVLRHALPESLPALVDAEREMIDDLLGGRIAGIVLDRRQADRLLEAGLPITILGPRLAKEEYALVLPVDRPRLRQEIDRHLRDLEKEGFLARLKEAYALEEAFR